MKDLTHYIDNRINFWNKMTGKTLMTLPLTDSEAQEVADSLSGQLSPENLHCDGEISRAEAQRKYNYFMRVHAQLETHMGRPVELYY